MSSPAPILVTGATSGLGRKLALRLGQAGLPVLVGGRRPDATRALCDEIDAGTPGTATPFLADLADLDAVDAAIEALAPGPLAGIVTNAGVTLQGDLRSAQGFELTFAVNVLAHQLLLCRLAHRVVDGGRIVCLSSGTHDPDNQLARFFRIPPPQWIGTRSQALPDDASASLPPGPLRYSTSKLGNILQARGLQARLRAAGRDIDVFALDPGLMVDTELAREAPGPLRAVFTGIGRLVTPLVDNMRLSDTSAGHIESLLTDPAWRGRGFAYVDGDQARPPSLDAQRDDLVDELWDAALPLIGLTPDTLRGVA